MNINLDLHTVKEYKHGKIIDYLYSFSVKWFNPGTINFDLPIHKDEVARIQRKVERNERIDPVIMLKRYGVIAGAHEIIAYKNLGYDRIPVLYGIPRYG